MAVTATTHKPTCTCPSCLMADMNAHLLKNGKNPDEYKTVMVEGERTRYKTPGTGSGRGVVRHISPAQIRYMEMLFEGKDLTRLVRLPGSENWRAMSLAGARDLIARLMALPWKPGYPKEKPATEKQLEWIKKEGQVRVLTDDIQVTVDAALAKGFVSFKDAKVALDYLFKAAYAVSVSHTEPVKPMEPGMYETPDGTIYKVQRARESGMLYAKRAKLVDGKMEFEFDPGAIRKLNGSMRMSVERAEELSMEFGCCIRCSKTLTNKVSVTAGIGPICRKKI